MRAGERNYRITFQRKTVVEDTMGGDIETWTDFATAYAGVLFNKGSERRATAQEGAAAAATFVVPANTKTRTIGVTDRISFDGSYWDIVSAIPSRQFNTEREIEAIRALA